MYCFLFSSPIENSYRSIGCILKPYDANLLFLNKNFSNVSVGALYTLQIKIQNRPYVGCMSLVIFKLPRRRGDCRDVTVIHKQ